jgi:phosphate starvation-inducible PhoH-like protein
MAKNRNKSKKKQNRRDEIESLRAIGANMMAKQEGPQKKTWSIHDLKSIQPITNTQKDFFTGYLQNSNINAYGSAGTGKTFLGLFLGLRDVIDKNMPQDQLIIVRSAVASRDVGHLPGDIDEKMAVFETPYIDICSELFRKPSTYGNMKEAGLIKFMPTSFIRGTTWDNSIILVDESQNMSWHEISSIMTRVGSNSKVILAGDYKQDDLYNKRNESSGIMRLINTTERMSEFVNINFKVEDIVRSDFVKSWIMASEYTE